MTWVDVKFSLQILEDKEAIPEEVIPFLGLKLKRLNGSIYPVKVPASQLLLPLLPPLVNLASHWVCLDEPLEPNRRYYLVCVNRRLFDVLKACTEGSDQTIDLVPDGADETMTRTVRMVFMQLATTEIIDLMGRQNEHLRTVEERLEKLMAEVCRIRSRLGLTMEYIRATHPDAGTSVAHAVAAIAIILDLINLQELIQVVFEKSALAGHQRHHWEIHPDIRVIRKQRIRSPFLLLTMATLYPESLT